MVKRDGGNAIYGHERIGQNGEKFKCLKFRAMVTNWKEVLEQLLATSAEARAEWDKDFKLKKDPRITSIGGFLSKTSLDELPQLWNVIRGEMSMVGPRPVIEAELERYAGDVDYYLMAKPGMTGLWQVSGRNDSTTDPRLYGCCSAVVAFSGVRDRLEGDDTARAYGFLNGTLNIVPALAPLLGGLLASAFDWRAPFWFLCAYGLLIVLLWLPETRPANTLRVKGLPLAQ